MLALATLHPHRLRPADLKCGHLSGRGIVDRIFDFMIRDFAKFALQLYSKRGLSTAQGEG